MLPPSSVFWVVMPCSVEVGYKLVRGPCYLQLVLWFVTPCSFVAEHNVSELHSAFIFKVGGKMGI